MEITKGLIMKTYVGKGKGINDNNEEIEFDMSINTFNMAPIITYKDKSFTLSWNDIVELAEKEGLFNE